MKTILIVDDLFENLYLLKVILEQAGYKVIEANDGKDALEKLQKNTVALIISDILMPVMDGYMFCQACKKDELFKNIPFVFYTSTYTEKTDEDFALKLGAAHFLRKPTDPDIIVALIQKLLVEVKSQKKPKEKIEFTEHEVLKLYSKRLISKLEQKNLALEKEIYQREDIERKLINENALLELIANNTPIKNVFDHIINNYQSNHPDFFVSISLLDDDGIHLDLISAPKISKEYNLAIKRIAIGENVGSCGTAAFIKRPVIVSDISTNILWVDFKEIALKHNLKSCWSIPILSERNTVLGTFAIYSNSIKTPSLKDIRELNSAVSLAKMTIVKFNIMAEVKKRDASYRALINQANDAILTFTFDGAIYDFNKATHNILGYTKDEFSELKLQDIIVGNIIENSQLHEEILNGKSVVFERQFVCKNKAIVDVEISTKIQKDGKVLSIARDITERKQSKLKLLKSEKSLLEAQKIAKIGNFNLDLKTRKIQGSATFMQILGVDVNDEFTADIWKTLIFEEDVATNLKLFQDCLETGEKFNMEFRILTKNKKTLKWIHGLGEITFLNGEAINFFGTAQDITDRKKIELEFKATKNYSENVISSLHEGLLTISMHSEILNVNPSFCKMTGFSKEELIGTKPPFPYWPSEEVPKIMANIKKGFTGEQSKFEETLMRKNGERFPVSIQTSIFLDEFGNRNGYVATVDDISNYVNTLEELRQAKEFSENLIMSMQEGLLIVDLEGRIIKVNDSLCDILGYSKQELIGMELPYPFAKEEDYENMLEIKNKVAKGEAPSFQLEFIKKNGSTFLASFLAGLIKNDYEEVIAIFATIKDISEEEKLKTTLKEIAIKSTQKKNVILELSSLVGSDYHNSLRKITALSAATLNTARVGIWKFNEERTSIICEKLYVLETGKCEAGVLLARNDNPNYFDALAKNKTINIEDAVNNSITKGFAKDYLIPLGISSMLDVFIQGNRGFHGVICFEHVGAKRKWSADDEEFATSIASIVTLMIESSERKIAENNLVIVNTELSNANKELNNLRDQLQLENSYLRNELDLVFNYEEMVYGSEAFSNVLTEVEKVAPTTATVLLLGESGTGKELLARAIHNISLRNNKPLIKVNCSAIPRELIESELFGHKKGSFTGAFSDKIGKFELADGGTLFLDEIGELPLDMQPKILRFLQEGEIEVVGGLGLKKLDVRVIAATNRNLKEEIERKQFREDLYFRLNVFPIEVPPLRKRIDDIPLLVEHFVDKFNKSYEKNIKYIPDNAMNQLKSYSWPGNIRELENLIERALILSSSNTLLIPGFETDTQLTKQLINNKDSSLKTIQRNHIQQVLEECKWKISGPKGASALLDIKPSTLRDKMKKLGIIKPIKK